jgi:hypothetical protein
MMRTTLALAALTLVAVTASAESKVRHPFESSVPRGNVRRVVVDIPAGDVTIRNGAADRLAVSGYVSREPDSPGSRDKEQRIVNDTTVEIYASNQEAIVRRRFGPEADSWRGSMFSDYKVVVDVPAGVSIDLQTRYGDVSIEGSFGDIDVDLRAGEIDLRIPQRDVRQLNASCRVGEVHTQIGDDIVDREGVFPGKTRYSNAAGKSIVNIHVTAGEIRATLTR